MSTPWDAMDRLELYYANPSPQQLRGDYVRIRNVYLRSTRSYAHGAEEHERYRPCKELASLGSSVVVASQRAHASDGVAAAADGRLVGRRAGVNANTAGGRRVGGEGVAALGDVEDELVGSAPSFSGSVPRLAAPAPVGWRVALLGVCCVLACVARGVVLLRTLLHSRGVGSPGGAPDSLPTALAVALRRGVLWAVSGGGSKKPGLLT